MVIIDRWTGREARALRLAKRMSLAAFAAHLGVSERTLSNWERGGSDFTIRAVNQAALDTSLAISGCDVQERFSALTRRDTADRSAIAYHQRGAPDDDGRQEQFAEEEMRRRTVLKSIGALAASPVPLVQWETLRQSMAAALDPDQDRWDQIVNDYGSAYYRLPADQMMESLRADLTILQAFIIVADGNERTALLRAAGRLSVIVALNMVAAGQAVTARRWWREARRHAEASRDPDTIVLARAWDVVNGCYDGRSPSEVVAHADEVLPLIGGRASAASCGLLAGRAQALALAGRPDEAIATLGHLARLADQLPSGMAEDVDSLWGWPEHRLRHTEVWVYAHTGRLAEATRAQERALTLYPVPMKRLRTQVRLHHAAALIRGGQIPDGLRLAADLLDELPAVQHNELLRAVARQVVDAVPGGEHKRPMFRELSERVSAQHSGA